MIARLAAVLTVLNFACALQAADKPNILLMYSDDQGYGELGCYGMKQVPTPHIDSIAANGIRFTQGYVSAPLCSPSRAGLMTGRYQTRFGHENNAMTQEHGLPLTEKTIANHLKALGYSTLAIGKWHLGSQPDQLPFKRGFDEYFGVSKNPGSYFDPNCGVIDTRLSPNPSHKQPAGFYTTEAFAQRAVDFIERNKAKPWFIYLPFNAIHAPHEAPAKYLKRFEHFPKQERALYAMLSAMDDAVGQVLAKLKALGQEENTLIFFISDNGAPPGRNGNGILRGSKYTTFEGGIRLPFLMQWKGILPAGTTYDHPAIQLDVLPTCVSAAGGQIDPAWKLDGVNLLPYLTGQDKSKPHETLYWKIDGMWAIRHGDMKLVHGLKSAGAPELFDLSTDPSEQKDLAASKPQTVAQLKTLWDQWNTDQEPGSRKKAAKNKEQKKEKKNK